MIELRCQNKMHGILSDEGIVEVKCDSRKCGARPGVIVLHRFSLADGSPIETLRFKNPDKEVKTRDASRIRSAVRSA